VRNDIAQFRRLLAARGQSISGLARSAHCGRSHLSQVLHNRPGRGGQTRRKIRPHLCPAELEALGWQELDWQI
jgi:hypothetical protein